MRAGVRAGALLPGSALLLALVAGCAGGQPPPSAPPPEQPISSGFRFVDVAEPAGLTRVNLSGRPDKDHVLDSIGTGAAWLDYDRDGHLDAYLVNSWRLSGSAIVERGRNALYRNRGDGTFEDVTSRAGVDGEGQWGCGVAVVDYDNDGWPDILVTNFGPNVLYRNRGDGTFENVAARAGVEAPGWNTGAAFFDADADGDLDLYVASYIKCTLESVLAARPSLSWKGIDQVALGPFGMEGAPDHFFLSDGQGGFTEATESAGLTDRGLAFGLGVRAADFDRDGDLDLYVANDSNANYLYRNEGGGRFLEVGLWSGAAFDGHGAAQAGMGLTVGDADGDGALDIFVTNFAEDFSTLYQGDGGGFFEDVSASNGVGPATFKALSWGAAFADLDADGDLDLVVANGHIYPQVDRHPQLGLAYAQRNLLLENAGNGRFTDATAAAGPGFAHPAPHRGLATGDYDDDGDLDLLLTRLDGPPLLLRNESARGSWLTVELRVPPGAGTAIGARVLVSAAGRTFIRDRASSDSYLSAHDPRLHFGLGAARVVERVEVLWPDGRRTLRTGVPVDQRLVLEPDPPREGGGARGATGVRM